MEILNLGNSEENTAPSAGKRKSKKLKAAIGFGGLAAVTGVGSTLAAQLTLNSGSAVEFGQGVAQTVACDSDGFTISPQTEYDNESGFFRLAEVQITGLDLTPQGTGYNLSGAGSYEDQAAAVLAHPGEYYNGSEWIPTCDGVVLDFKAYTDDSDFTGLTTAASTAYPLFLIDPYDANEQNRTSNFAFSFNTTDGTYSTAYEDNSANDGYYWWIDWNGDGMSTANASVTMEINQRYGVNAAAISKFTAESMPEFPSSYLFKDDEETI